MAGYDDHLSKGSLSLTYMSGLSGFSLLRVPDKVYKSEMSHHAGKVFVFVLGACAISQCVGPNCFLCENMGCKSRWLAEDLSLAGALRPRLQWLMGMVNTVLPSGSHVGARGKGTLSALSPASCGWKSRGHPTYSSLFSFCSVSKQHSLGFLCLFLSIATFFRRSDQ